MGFIYLKNWRELFFFNDSEEVFARDGEGDNVVAVLDASAVWLQSVEQSGVEVGNHRPISRPNSDLTFTQGDKKFFFIDEDESVRRVKIMNQLGLISKDVVDLQGLAFLLN